MDAQWSDDFHHALFTVLNREPEAGYYSDFGKLCHLAKALEQTFVYDGIYSNYRRRVHGRPATYVSQHRFLGFIQNHDQIGNRRARSRQNRCRARPHQSIYPYALSRRGVGRNFSLPVFRQS
jgi:maltooligosyltrehalose trehalohydrolase